MYTLVSETKTELAAGTVVHVLGDWHDYLTLRSSRGDGAMPRIKYCDGTVTLMNPLPRHGREASLLADIVKVLLDHQQQNYEAFTPITMELPERGGIEPDYCFYIPHWRAVVGRDRLDWEHDPPPDLVLEVDVTNYTNVDDYRLYQVPEVWILKKTRLTIYALKGKGYEVQSRSLYFPEIDVVKVSNRVFKEAATEGSGTAIRSLRQTLDG